MYLIGIDIGTSSTKGVLINKNGSVIAEAKRLHGVEHPKPGWAEQNAERLWWNETVEIIRELLTASGVSGKEIAAIGCSGVCPVIVPIDKSGKPLRNAILYSIDARAKKQINLLNKKLNENNSYNDSGQPLSYQSIMPKLMWLKENEAEIWEKTDVVLGSSSYITYKLCGVKTVDHFSAGDGGFGYSLKNLGWSNEAFQIAGIDIDKMPKLSWSTDVAGYITKESAELTGLIQGTPVIAGTGDALAEMISTGVSQVGETALLYGSTLTTMTVLNKPWLHEGFITVPGWTSKQIVTSAVMGSGMSLFSWFRRFLNMNSDKELFSFFEEKIHAVPKGADDLIILPYLSGQRSPVINPDIRGSFIGLSQHHTSLDVFRALIEGLGFALRESLCALGDRCNQKTLRVVGGGVQSDILLQIVSDITRFEQNVVSGLVGAPLGSAWLAGKGVKLIDGESPEKWLEIEKRVIHIEENSAEYDRIYSKFLSVLDEMKPIYSSP